MLTCMMEMSDQYNMMEHLEDDSMITNSTRQTKDLEYHLIAAQRYAARYLDQDDRQTIIIEQLRQLTEWLRSLPQHHISEQPRETGCESGVSRRNKGEGQFEENVVSEGEAADSSKSGSLAVEHPHKPTSVSPSQQAVRQGVNEFILSHSIQASATKYKFDQSPVWKHSTSKNYRDFELMEESTNKMLARLTQTGQDKYFYRLRIDINQDIYQQAPRSYLIQLLTEEQAKSLRLSKIWQVLDENLEHAIKTSSRLGDERQMLMEENYKLKTELAKYTKKQAHQRQRSEVISSVCQNNPSSGLHQSYSGVAQKRAPCWTEVNPTKSFSLPHAQRPIQVHKSSTFIPPQQQAMPIRPQITVDCGHSQNFMATFPQQTHHSGSSAVAAPITPPTYRTYHPTTVSHPHLINTTSSAVMPGQHSQHLVGSASLDRRLGVQAASETQGLKRTTSHIMPTSHGNQKLTVVQESKFIRRPVDDVVKVPLFQHKPLENPLQKYGTRLEHLNEEVSSYIDNQKAQKLEEWGDKLNSARMVMKSKKEHVAKKFKKEKRLPHTNLEHETREGMMRNPRNP